MIKLDFAPSLEYCEIAAIELCKHLEINVSSTTLVTLLQEHPEYPSLLAISDVLIDIGVDNTAIKSSVDEISSLPGPFIVLVNGKTFGSNAFYVVREINSNIIHFYDTESKAYRSDTLENFSEIYMSVALVCEPTTNAGEKEFKVIQQQEKLNKFIKLAIVLGVPLVGLSIAVNNVLHSWDLWMLFPVLYCFLSIVGLYVSGMLLFYDIDSNNSIFESICRTGEKRNCHAILQSNAAKILGISWSLIGFGYFCASYGYILLKGFNSPSAIYTLFLFSAITSTYIFYSVFYQWKVAKQWCTMCLTVQAILALQLFTSFLGDFYKRAYVGSIIVEDVTIFVLLFFLCLIGAQLFIISFKKAKESKLLDFQLKRLKNNKTVFEALLNEQKKLESPANELGITIGNPNGELTLLKVCNPYCGACAVAQPYIDELIDRNPNLRVQIIFTASVAEGDFQGPVVKHLMAIDAQNDKSLTRAALDDWYGSPVKDYNRFSLKYPMNGQLKEQDSKLRAMSEWCDRYQIAVTPTFFINGRQLPKEYNYANLKYVLK